MKKIIFTGGGTGGHIMPNIAIMDELKNKFDIAYIGSKNGMEKEIIKNVPYFEITTCKLKRSLDISNLLIPFKLIKGYFDAKKILKKEKPNLVFSKGGYVSVPVIFACKSLKIPVVSHESDYTLGLANKLTSKIAKAVCTSFEDTAKAIKNGVYTGSPIRKELLNGNKNNIKNKLDLKQNLPTLLVVGGSLGSKKINEIIKKNAKKLQNKYNLVHITGKNDKFESFENYNALEYTNQIGDVFDLADLVITRGGSNVLFELLALKKPMLIVPLEKGSRGDQILNASVFEKEGLALAINEDDLLQNSALLFDKLEELWNKRDELKRNMQNKNIIGNKKIVEQIEKYMK